MSAERPPVEPDGVRQQFLDFFKKHGHTEVPSAPLVPENDPTLLFTGAGMNQFKDHFLGRVPLRFKRAVTSQKCLRTGDLENVGRTPGHHTFFEMLGNFSFGDYFKEDAIRWVWEFLTAEMGLPSDRLWVSVYQDDEEAARLWKKHTPLRDDRIARLGAKSNFWPSNAPEDGPDGPCGPCSEIYFDLGYKPAPEGLIPPCTPGLAAHDRPERVDCDCRQYLEVWNLVFQQFDRQGKNKLVPLKMQNIDTGMGFERLLMVRAVLRWEASGRPSGEKIDSNFQTGIFRPLVQAVLDTPAGRGGTSPEDHVRARRIADHSRAAVFCVADQVHPSNEGRGYVLRRIIRRAVRDGLQLDIREPFLHALVEPIGRSMGKRYPDVVDGRKVIEHVLRAEEERFRQTYAGGSARLTETMIRLHGQGVSVLPAAEAFQLHDTYGFPVDLTVDVLRENMMTLDREGFAREMERARERSREGSKMAGDVFATGPLARAKKSLPPTVFLGYGPVPEKPDGTYDWDPGVSAGSKVAEILRGETPADRIAEEEEGTLLLRETPFYAEQGGQVGDAGEIRGPGGALFLVRDTQRVEGFHLHVGRMERGSLGLGDPVEAAVDRARRDAIRRNHTGTHLLHRVLKAVLGEDAKQAGALVAPDRLRFDFTWPRALTPGERRRVEDEVNRRIAEDHAVETRVHDPASAKATGAVSMFGEKYGDRIRVLTAGDSREFCGGTHCRRTSDIESFRLVSEKSIGSGVRRIEALTGREAVRAFDEEQGRQAEAERWRAEEARLRKQVVQVEGISSGEAFGAPTLVQVPDLLAVPRRSAGPIEFAAVPVAHGTEEILLRSADRVKDASGPAYAVFLYGTGQDGVPIVAVGNPAAVRAGFKAGAAVQAAAKALGGGGGGRPDLARGKGKDAGKIPDAVEAFATYVRGIGKPAGTAP